MAAAPSTVFLELKKIKSVTLSAFLPSICHEVMGLDTMILVFWMLSFKPAFSLFFLTLIKRLFSFSLVAQSCPALCNPMDCSMPDFPVFPQFPELAQTHVHWVSDAIQPSHPLSSPSSPAFNLSQHQGLFQWISLLHQVTKVLEFQLQHQSFQWIFWTDFL